MKAAGEPAVALGLRLATEVLDAGGVRFTTAPMLPASVVSSAFRTLPDLLADVSDDTVLKVGRVLRQSVLGQQTPLDAMRAIRTIVGPAKGVDRPVPQRRAALGVHRAHRAPADKRAGKRRHHAPSRGLGRRAAEGVVRPPR
jgi:hypothetical protein